MRLQALSPRRRHLAFWLGLLALCSALIAPAAVLAEEMRTGKWIGLCGPGPSDRQASHTEGDGDHCDLCALPALALPLLAVVGTEPAVRTLPAATPGVSPGLADRRLPAIRGPPSAS